MTITKTQLVKMLDGIKDDTPMYIRVEDDSTECEVVTAQDIIDECVERTDLFWRNRWNGHWYSNSKVSWLGRLNSILWN